MLLNPRNFCEADQNSEKMNHVQTVTVLEASYPEKNITASRNGGTIKRNVVNDLNNNEPQVITKESLNVATTSPTESEEPEEYTLLGLITFKSPIKWLNSISIVLIHLIFIYAVITYPLHNKLLTSAWGE